MRVGHRERERLRKGSWSHPVGSGVGEEGLVNEAKEG